MLIKTESREKDVNILEVTPQNYIVPAGENHLYHAVIEVKQFNPQNGERLSVPRLQKFGLKTFEAGGVKNNLKKQGFSILVLHDPKKWIVSNKKETEAKAEELAKQRSEAKENAVKAAEEKKAEETNAAIDAAVSKALEAQAANTQKAIDAAVAAALAKQAKPETTAKDTKAAK